MHSIHVHVCMAFEIEEWISYISYHLPSIVTMPSSDTGAHSNFNLHARVSRSTELKALLQDNYKNNHSKHHHSTIPGTVPPTNNFPNIRAFSRIFANFANIRENSRKFKIFFFFFFTFFFFPSPFSPLIYA